MDSPYLRGASLSKADLNTCWYCGRPNLTELNGGRASPHSRTIDHVLPRDTGNARQELSKASDAEHPIRTVRPCCYRCNQSRALLGHCCGALMLGLIEGEYDSRHAPPILWHLFGKAPPDTRRVRTVRLSAEFVASGNKLGDTAAGKVLASLGLSR